MNVAAVINAGKQQCYLRGPNNFLQNNFLFLITSGKNISSPEERKKYTAEDISLPNKMKTNIHKTKKPPNSNRLYQED